MSNNWNYPAAAAKLLQSCPTLCDPIDSSPPGSPVPGILQARTLEWVAISFSNAWKWKVKVKSLSRVRLLATPWTAAYQAPLSMGFSRQEYWSGVPLPSLETILGFIYSLCFILFIYLIIPLSWIFHWHFLFQCVFVCVYVCVISRSVLSDYLWPLACQAPLSMEFSRQEYWSELTFSTPGDLPKPGIKSASLASPALAGGFFTAVPPASPSMCKGHIMTEVSKS